jgi:hypothetical protein
MKKELKSHEIKPSAFIVSPKDKGRKAIKSGNIYLDNNENFEIELYNPLKVNVLADIRLNGQSISQTGLIIKPGQRFYLDCFVDDKKKFSFQSYHVEDSKESKDAIVDNGIMEVFFYKEESITLQNWAEKFRKIAVREYYPIYIDRYPYWYPYNQPYITYGSTNITSGGALTSNTISGYQGNTTISSTLSGGNNLTFCNSTANSLSCDTNSLNLINDGSFNLSSLSSGVNPNPIETGRVEKGETSNQQFEEVNIDFEKNYIHHIVYQLLPSSRMPVEVSGKKGDGRENQFLPAIVDTIRGLADLRDSGIITEIEFEEKKKELLSRI